MSPPALTGHQRKLGVCILWLIPQPLAQHHAPDISSSPTNQKSLMLELIWWEMPEEMHCFVNMWLDHPLNVFGLHERKWLINVKQSPERSEKTMDLCRGGDISGEMEEIDPEVRMITCFHLSSEAAKDSFSVCIIGRWGTCAPCWLRFTSCSPADTEIFLTTLLSPSLPSASPRTRDYTYGWRP